MSLDDPVVITCAISGAIANREQCPAIPYTPSEYASEARRIVDEGGVMIHIHARKPDGTPSYEVEDFMAISYAIREEVGDDVIVNFSTGTIGVPVAKRIEYLRACRPEVAALNMGSMNYAKYSRSRRQFVFNMVFANPFEEIIELLEAMNELGIKPEHECFDIGHVGSLAPLIDMGVLHTPLHVDCVMGVVGGIPPTAANLAAMVANIPEGSHWGVIGISRDQWMLVGAALGVEKLTVRKTAGVLVAMAGVFVALVFGLSGAPSGAWRGELIMVVATCCMSLYNVWSRPFIARSDPLAFLTAGMGAAAFCLLVWALAIHGFDAVSRFGAPQWVAIAYLGIVGSAGAFILWVFALSRTSPTRTAVTITVNPVFASIVGALAIGESIGVNLVVGLAAVAVGIWLAAR